MKRYQTLYYLYNFKRLKKEKLAKEIQTKKLKQDNEIKVTALL